MKYLGEPDYQHDDVPRTGVLLVNLGTPDAPDTGSLGARNDGVEIIGEVGEIEMTVAVDKHQFFTAVASGGSI